MKEMVRNVGGHGEKSKERRAQQQYDKQRHVEPTEPDHPAGEAVAGTAKADGKGNSAGDGVRDAVQRLGGEQRVGTNR